jgi:hypothetical protein
MLGGWIAECVAEARELSLGLNGCEYILGVLVCQ